MLPFFLRTASDTMADSSTRLPCCRLYAGFAWFRRIPVRNSMGAMFIRHRILVHKQAVA